eukprot:4630732-Prymnesium_polylepis.2
MVGVTFTNLFVYGVEWSLYAVYFRDQYGVRVVRRVHWPRADVGRPDRSIDPAAPDAAARQGGYRTRGRRAVPAIRWLAVQRERAAHGARRPHGDARPELLRRRAPGADTDGYVLRVH